MPGSDYDIEREDSPEYPNCCAGSFSCGPHPAIDYHEVCQEPVDQCACLRPALHVARALLGLADPDDKSRNDG